MQTLPAATAASPNPTATILTPPDHLNLPTKDTNGQIQTVMSNPATARLTDHPATLGDHTNGELRIKA